jgi:hypothetical protein
MAAPRSLGAQSQGAGNYFAIPLLMPVCLEGTALRPVDGDGLP